MQDQGELIHLLGLLTTSFCLAATRQRFLKASYELTQVGAKKMTKVPQLNQVEPSATTLNIAEEGLTTP